jgi:hypothetical protein
MVSLSGARLVDAEPRPHVGLIQTPREKLGGVIGTRGGAGGEECGGAGDLKNGTDKELDLVECGGRRRRACGFTSREKAIGARLMAVGSSMHTHLLFLVVTSTVVVVAYHQIRHMASKWRPPVHMTRNFLQQAKMGARDR